MTWRYVVTSLLPIGRLSWRRQEVVWGYICISPFLFGFVFFTAGPLVFSLYMSLQKYVAGLPPSFVGFYNYAYMAHDPLFWQSLRVTAIYSLFVVPLGIVVGFSLALLMNQGVKGIGVWRTVYYMPSVVSGVAVSMMWLWLLNPDFGVVNSLLHSLGIPGPGWLTSISWALPTLIIMSLWAAGGSMIIYLAGLQGVPKQLYEAAAIDGAGTWGSFLNVTVPLMTPILFYELVIGIIGTFQVFINAFIMTGGGPAYATLFYVLYLFQQGFEQFHLGLAAAMAWVLFAIVMVLTLIVFKSSALWVYYEGEIRGRAG